jgi:hypothetical protein
MRQYHVAQCLTPFVMQIAVQIGWLIRLDITLDDEAARP